MSGTGSGCFALASAVLLPDILGTYSDAGNAVVLASGPAAAGSRPTCAWSGSPMSRLGPRTCT